MKETYGALWKRMTIPEDRKSSVVSVAHRCISAKARYQAVADQLGLPKATGWAWIACIHIREANGNFHSHLHNGDPLTARTTHVPAGRPLAGNAPFTWEESAADAISMRGLKTLAANLTSLEGFAWESEGYNGWGYFYHDVASPYLWGATDCQQSGKYVADGKWDASFVDPQIGVMALLQTLQAMDPSIKFGAVVAPISPPKAAPVPTQAAPATWVHTLYVTLSTILGSVSAVANAFQTLQPYLTNPVVIGAIVAALVGLGIFIVRAHHAHAPA